MDHLFPGVSNDQIDTDRQEINDDQIDKKFIFFRNKEKATLMNIIQTTNEIQNTQNHRGC